MNAHRNIFAAAVILSCLALFTANAQALTPGEEWDRSVPEWLRTFHPGGPEYRGQWAYSDMELGADKDKDKGWIPTLGLFDLLRVQVSRGDNSRNTLWASEPFPGTLMGGASFSNDIASWLNPPEGMTRSIRYVILDDYSSGGHVNNSDIVEIDENQVETLMKHGYKFYPAFDEEGNPYTAEPHDTLGLVDFSDYGIDYAISALDFKADLAPLRVPYDHWVAINTDMCDYYAGTGDRPTTCQSDEDMYFTGARFGAFDDEGNLKYAHRLGQRWGDGEGTGYPSKGYGYGRFDFSQGEKLLPGKACYSNGRWWSMVEIDETTYWLYLEDSDGSIKPYDPDKYPEDPAHPGDPEAASGYPIRWHDDYELEGTYGYNLGVDTHGVTGRWVVERSGIYKWYRLKGSMHAGDIMSETRTYNPYGNEDGPLCQYDWLYDESGEMYVPTGTPPPEGWSDDPYERAFQLIAHHPAFPNDDTRDECETDEDDINNYDRRIGGNFEKGVVSQQYFEKAWKIAGCLLGDRFWEEGCFWSNVEGGVATREFIYDNENHTNQDAFVEIGGSGGISYPRMYWDDEDNKWYFTSSAYDTEQPDAWGWLDHYVDHIVPGHDALNAFVRYVMDIDALVIQDVNGNGVYDEEEDYILFSLVDDGRYTRMLHWGESATGIPGPSGIDTPFEGEYFSGETIFLYHNCEVTTWFDPTSGVFFGESISTIGGTLWHGTTVWSMTHGMYELNALDIGLVPEPTTIILIVGAGLAFGAGVLRRKMR